MKYADVKLREEEQRATKYLESCSGSVQVFVLFKQSMSILSCSK